MPPRLALLAAGALLLAALAPSAVAFDARVPKNGADGLRVLKDRRASGGRAVLITGRAPLRRRRVRVPPRARVTLRARGFRCKGLPRAAVSVERRRVGSVRVRTGRWRFYSINFRTRPRRHELSVGLANAGRGRHCQRRLALDTVTIRAQPRKLRPVRIAGPIIYQNPVFADSAPDPMVLYEGGRYYAYTTGDRFPILVSDDLVHWSTAGTALASRPVWAAPQADYNPWAPGVAKRSGPCPGTSSSACFVMFYVSLNTVLEPDTNCIGVATSTSPLGPFQDQGPLRDVTGSVDQSGRFIGCGDDRGYYNIDPAPFVDSDGQAYLYLSTSRRCDAPAPFTTCPSAPTISVVKLTPDLQNAASPRQDIFAATQGWEKGIVENPWMVKRGKAYFLFYSGGDYKAVYGMNFAASSAPTGGFNKWRDGLVITDSSEVSGAGGGMVVTGKHGGDWLVYHGRNAPFPAPRMLRIDPIIWAYGFKPTVDGPTTLPQRTAP